MLSGDGTGQGGRSSTDETAALATALILRFPQAMRAVLDLLAAIAPARWPIEIEALQRSAQALERARLAHMMLDRLCGPAPATASAVTAHVIDERPAGDVHATYQIGGRAGSKLSIALDHLSAELVIAQQRVALSDDGVTWSVVLRDLRTLLEDPRIGALLDGPAVPSAPGEDA